MLTDGLWIIVMFLSDSHSDGTHSLQWRASDAMLHFFKSDEETNTSTSRMTRGWAHFQYIFGSTINITKSSFLQYMMIKPV